MASSFTSEKGTEDALAIAVGLRVLRDRVHLGGVEGGDVDLMSGVEESKRLLGVVVGTKKHRSEGDLRPRATTDLDGDGWGKGGEGGRGPRGVETAREPRKKTPNMDTYV